MRRDPRAYLFDVLQAADAISAFLSDRDYKAFVGDDLLRSAVERKFEIIGEALNQLGKLDAALVSRISQWRDIVAFRNILVHGYASLDLAIVWRANTESLPLLRSEVEALLRESQDP